MGSIDRSPAPPRPESSIQPPAPPVSTRPVPPPAGKATARWRAWFADPTVRIASIGGAAVLLVLVGRWSARPEAPVIIRTASAPASAAAGLPGDAPSAGTATSASNQAPPVPPPSAEIAADIAAIDARLRQAEAEDARLAGGLVKALLGSEMGILRQTRAMLEQRASSWTFGIGLRYSVDGKPFVPPADAPQQLATVEADIAHAKEKLAAAEAEAARYSGGLVQALSLSTVATIRNSLAMLEQRRLALKYALPQFVGFQGERPAAPAAADARPAAAPAPAERKWSIVEVDSRVTESNDTWWRYAWKLTLRNDESSDLAFDATIEFQDGEGFVIDSDRQYGLLVPAGTEKTFTGFDLVSLPGATRVARTNAKVAPR